LRRYAIRLWTHYGVAALGFTDSRLIDMLHEMTYNRPNCRIGCALTHKMISPSPIICSFTYQHLGSRITSLHHGIKPSSKIPTSPNTPGTYGTTPTRYEPSWVLGKGRLVRRSFPETPPPLVETHFAAPTLIMYSRRPTVSSVNLVCFCCDFLLALASVPLPTESHTGVIVEEKHARCDWRLAVG